VIGDRSVSEYVFHPESSERTDRDHIDTLANARFEWLDGGEMETSAAAAA
jgi:hypothetical protein